MWAKPQPSLSSRISKWSAIAGIFLFLVGTSAALANEYMTSSNAVGCVLPSSVDKALLLMSRGAANSDALDALGCVKLKKGLRIILLQRLPKDTYEVLLYGGDKPMTAYLTGTSFADPSTGATVWDIR